MTVPRSPSDRSNPSRALGALGLALVVAASPHAVLAETIAAGKITDAVTGAPVAGAKVSIRGETVLGETRSDDGGVFRVSFDAGTSALARRLELIFEHEDYTAVPESVVVTSGRTDKTAYPVQMAPKWRPPCMKNPERKRRIVVGHFRPPLVGPAMQVDLAGQIAEVLRTTLLPPITQRHLSLVSQPLVVDCDEARPRSPEDAAIYAKGLDADAFISGWVSPSGNRFKVEMTVGNRHDKTAPTVRSSSKDVDLIDPSEARLDPKANEAVLGAIVAGYEQGNAAECVEVIAAAERILQSLPASFAEAKRRCQDRLPNRGLLRGGTP